MKPFHCILAIASMAMALPTTAGQRAAGTEATPAFRVPNTVGDPFIALYRGSGVRDDGGASGAGVATSFHCTNFSAGTETVRWTIRNYDNTLLVQTTLDIGVQQTRTASTHATNIFDEDVFLFVAPTVVDQGYITIHATSSNIICSAQVVDAASTSPTGWNLHMVRFNNMTGAAGE